MDVLKLALLLGDYRLGVDFLVAGFCLDALAPWEAPESVRKARSWGAQQQVEIINAYHKNEIRTDILLVVLAKKLEFIASAATMAQVKEIIRPSLPDFQTGVFRVTSPYHVEEEELVLWSLFSPECRMRFEVMERALDLFERYLRKWGKDGNDGGTPAKDGPTKAQREEQSKEIDTQGKGT